MEPKKLTIKEVVVGLALALGLLGIVHEFQSDPTPKVQPKASPTTLELYQVYQAASRGDAPALQELRTNAERGNAYAQSTLGLMYFSGEGLPKDSAVAVRWYRRAADQGDADAQYNLGYMFLFGEGVPRDPAMAEIWIRRAAEQKHVGALNGLGYLYENGEGVPKNLSLALKWYRQAANQGNTDAQRNLERVVQAQHQNAIRAGTAFEVVLQKQSGVLVVPVLINSTIPLDFVIDSGAADVQVPADVVSTLMRTGTLTATDFTGTNTYVLADGSMVPSQTFRIRSLKVGNWVLENVSGSVGSWNGSLLLGQSFLNRFKSWSIDNARQVLVLQN